MSGVRERMSVDLPRAGRSTAVAAARRCVRAERPGHPRPDGDERGRHRLSGGCALLPVRRCAFMPDCACTVDYQLLQRAHVCLPRRVRALREVSKLDSSVSYGNASTGTVARAGTWTSSVRALCVQARSGTAAQSLARATSSRSARLRSSARGAQRPLDPGTP